jgi:integrase
MHETPYGANRVLSLVGAFFTYAEKQGVRPRHSNPVHDVEPFKEQPRERYLRPEEVVRLGEALTRAEREGLPVPDQLKNRSRGISARRRAKVTGRRRGPYKQRADRKTTRPANPFAIAAIRFLLLTGWREGEALTLKWSDVDLESGLAMLADTKTGRSPRRIGVSALSLLEDLPRIENSPYVFPGRSPDKPLVEINRLWYAARSAAGLDNVRLHDLRHSFASVSASSGGSLLETAKMLGHRNTSTTARYAHLFDDSVRATADATSKQLAAWMAGRGPLRLIKGRGPRTRKRGHRREA